MFETFPKTRPELPEEIKNIVYKTYYKSNRNGQTAASSLSQKMETWLHKQVAKDVKCNQHTNSKTLEIGAGTLNQIKYEPTVESYDIVEPFKSLYQDSPFLDKVNNIYSDISEIKSTTEYDRIISVAVLEHICNLPEVIAKSGLLLNKNGTFRASIPSEGTFLWKLGWKLTTGLEFKLKYGLDYELFVKHEHINTADEIETVLEYFFKDVECKVFGLSKSISFYRYYECKNAKVDRCQHYIDNIVL